MRARGLQQSLEGIKAIASLFGGAIVLWLVYEVAGLLLPGARDAAPGGLGGVKMNDWFTTGLDVGLPALFLGLVFFGLVATAVIARGVLR